MPADTNIESLFETLLAEGVLTESDDEAAVRPTEAFERARERRHEDLADATEAEFADEAEAFLAGVDLAAADVDRDVLIDAMAAHEFSDSLDVEESLQVADSLDRIETTMQESGVPAGFVSVAGEEMEAFLDRHPASILYFWREDCEPCDELKADVEDLVREGRIPEEIGLGALYGPECPTDVLSRYDVGAAPTTLFCVGDRVASRFVGYPGAEPFMAEVDLLQEELDS